MTDDLDNMLQWIVIQATMFRKYDQAMRMEIAELFSKSHLLPKESAFGNPPTDCNLTHQLYHLMQSGINLSALDSIVEFGGGYGAMAVVFWQLGYRGKYLIYDLPEWSLLQQYYLSNVTPEMEVEYSSQEIPENVDLFLALYSVSEVLPLEYRKNILNSVKPDTFFITHQKSYREIDQIIDNDEWFNEYILQRDDYCWNIWPHPYISGHRYIKGELS
jgi:hypothetical protein